MIRSFLAIAPPPEVVDALEDVQEGLPGASWTLPENLHLTLVFLGEQSVHALQDLDAGLAGMRKPRFSLSLSGVGTFGLDRRIAFAGVSSACAGRGAPLRELQAWLAARAEEAGVATERRKYSPHVTVARWRKGEMRRDRLEGWLAANALFAAGPFEAAEVTLYRSTLTRDGPIYEPMAAYPLGA